MVFSHFLPRVKQQFGFKTIFVYFLAQDVLKDEVLNSLMALPPAAWNTIRSVIQNLLLKNSDLDRNNALKAMYALHSRLIQFIIIK